MAGGVIRAAVADVSGRSDKNGPGGWFASGDMDFTRQMDFSPMQLRAHGVLNSLFYPPLMNGIIVFHLCMTWYETDQRAQNIDRRPWQHIAEYCLLASYVSDIVLRWFVNRMYFFRNPTDIFDVVIVGADCIGTLVELLFQGAAGPGTVSLLRGLRTLRVVRVVRKFSAFRDLYFMMQGMLGALRAIFFAATLMFAVLSMFSMLAVDVIHPLNQILADEGYYPDCTRCPRAFSSIMSSNLTFLQAVIAGDSWGVLSIPLMENYPSTALIILGCFLTIEFALMNVITAVVVDRQAQAREEDKQLQHMLKEERESTSYKELLALFEEMDQDGGGSLSLEELTEAYNHSQDFQKMLAWSDVGKEDLPNIFRLLDTNQNGEIDYTEFVHQLHRLRHVDMRTTVVMARLEAMTARSVAQEVKTMMNNAQFLIHRICAHHGVDTTEPKDWEDPDMLEKRRLMSSTLVAMSDDGDSSHSRDEVVDPAVACEGVAAPNGEPRCQSPAPPAVSDERSGCGEIVRDHLRCLQLHLDELQRHLMANLAVDMPGENTRKTAKGKVFAHEAHPHDCQFPRRWTPPCGKMHETAVHRRKSKVKKLQERSPLTSTEDPAGFTLHSARSIDSGAYKLFDEPRPKLVPKGHVCLVGAMNGFFPRPDFEQPRQTREKDS